jgi:uncharacterized membrane protein YgcG
MVRRKTAFLLMFILILSISLAEASNSKQRVYDYANLLGKNEVEELEKIAEKYSKKAGNRFYNIDYR